MKVKDKKTSAKADADLAEKLFAHASDHQAGLRAMVKGLRHFGAEPALAVVKGLAAMLKSKEVTDHLAAEKVYKTYEQIAAYIEGANKKLDAAKSDAKKTAELEEAAARYVSTHASVAAMQSWRALGGRATHERLVRQRIIQAIGSLQV